jgi:hypothetical protein
MPASNRPTARSASTHCWTCWTTWPKSRWPNGAGEDRKTFAVGLLIFIGKFAADREQMMAASILALDTGMEQISPI